MILSALDALVRPDRAAAAVDSSLVRRAWTVFRVRRWRRARPFTHLNDHLRRDIGLPPLDGDGWWR